MADWFYSDGDQRLGPVPGSALKQLAQSGKITRQTLVWTQGAAEWVDAGTVKGLFPPVDPALTPTPTPYPPGGPTDGGAQMLAYAPTGLKDGTLAPAPFAPPPDDPGPYQKMGNRFSVAGAQWTGKSFVTPNAIYLLKVARNRQNGYFYGGVLGMALSAALSKDDLMRTCDITELPPRIRMQFDPKMKKKKGDMLVLYRESMTRVKYSGFTGLTAMIGAEKFPISPPFFGGGKMRRFMTDNGWVFNQDLIPTIAPTHGKAYGLDEATAAKRKKKSFWVGIVSTVLGVIFFIFYIWLRVFALRH